MYGVNMSLKRPFAAALIGGAFYGVTGVASYIVGGNAGFQAFRYSSDQRFCMR